MPAKRKNKKRKHPPYMDSTMKPSFGWYQMHRGFQDHPIFGDEPFCSPMAWEMLIQDAVWHPQGQLRFVCGTEIRLKRGQLLTTLDNLSERWGWDRNRVNRFLGKLEEAKMIETSIEMNVTLITICNYDQYQGAGLPFETASEKRVRQEPNRKETIYKKDNHLKNDKKLLDAASEPWRSAVIKINPGMYIHWLNDFELKEGYLISSNAMRVSHVQDHFQQELVRIFGDVGIELRGVDLQSGSNDLVN